MQLLALHSIRFGRHGGLSYRSGTKLFRQLGQTEMTQEHGRDIKLTTQAVTAAGPSLQSPHPTASRSKIPSLIVWKTESRREQRVGRNCSRKYYSANHI